MSRWGLRARLRELAGLPPTPPRDGLPAVPPPPRIELDLHGAVPGPVIRALPPLLVFVCGGLAGGGPLVWLLAVVAAVLVAWRPVWPAAPVFALYAGICVYVGPDLLGAGLNGMAAAGGLVRVAGLVMCVHLLLRLTALSVHVGWRTLVEVPVIVRVARSVLGIQVIAQSLVLAVVWLRSGVGGTVAGQEWLRLLAVVSVVVGLFVIVPRTWLVRRDPARGGGSPLDGAG